MDKVDDQSPIQKTKISFSEELSRLEKGDGTSQQQNEVEEADPESMADWEQRTPYTTMQVDTSYLNKSGSASSKLSKPVSVALMVISIALVWVLMSLPSLCHFEVICSRHASTQVTVQTPLQNRFNCSGMPYIGGVCSPYLPSCSDSPFPLTNVAKNDTYEEDLQKLFSVLSSPPIVSSSCIAESDNVKQFVCQYVYQPCDSQQLAYLPHRNMCQYIRDDICSNEWNALANNAMYGSFLPTCDALRNTTEPHCTEGSKTPTPSTTASSTPATTGRCSPYVGSVCTNQLQICPGSTATGQMVDTSAETILELVVDRLQSDGAEQSCAQAESTVLEFLCVQFYKPCDDADRVLQPNRSTCEMLRDQLCPNTWANYVVFLPNCSSLNETVMQPVCNATAMNPTPLVSTLPPTSTNNAVTSTLNLTCNEEMGFREMNGTCQPLCSRWKAYSQVLSDLGDGIIMTCVVIGLLGGVAVMFFSVVRYERVLVFPTVFIVYLTLDLIVLGIIVLVQYIDRFGLSCTPDDILTNTIDNPTKFCTASGFILYYVLISLTWFWFVHVVSTFWKVMWPFQAREYERWQPLIHIICLALGLILPLGPPLGAYFFEGYSYSRFPPLLCFARNNTVTYYGLVLPISVAVAIGMSLLIIILHVLQQKQRLFRHRDTTHKYFLGLSAAEKKIIIIFMYYIILATVDLVAFTISNTILESLENAIRDNFLCEAVRTDPSMSCPRDFESIRLTEAFSYITFCLLGLFPLVNLLFAVNIREVKAKFRHWCTSYDSRSRTASTNLSVPVPPESPPFTLRRNKSYSFNRSPQPVNTKQVGTVGKAGKFLNKTATM